jgi:FkbM family methyltransferase
MTSAVFDFIRRLTGPFVYRKRLPPEFDSQRIYVTSRSDLRFLAPGLSRIGAELFAVVRTHVRPGDVVWDIGSNLGIFAFPAAIRAGPNGQVYSLEADSRYADLQSRTIRILAKDAAPTSVLCAAAADGPGVLELVIPKKGHSRNHLSTVKGINAGPAEMTKQVLSVSLDALLGHWRAPDFVKIDVEGAERLVADGAERLFREVRPAAFIECEDGNVEYLTGFFRRLGYSLHRQRPDGGIEPLERFAFNTLVLPPGRSPA